jgi:hypothetical protein
LPGRIADFLIGVRLVAAEVVLGLIPIPFERGLGAFLCGIVFFIPPVWIFVLVHDVNFCVRLLAFSAGLVPWQST